MNWEIVFKGLNAAALIASAILNVYLWFKSKTDKRFEDLERALGSHRMIADAEREYVRLQVAERKAHPGELSERVSLVEEKLEHLPTHDDLAEIHNKLSDVGSRVSATDERSKILLDGMRRIENHLMDR